MTDASTSRASNDLSSLLGATPEAILNELFNIVHCAAADVVDRFEEILVESCVHSNHDPEEILAGVEEMYADLVQQIEENMSVFVSVALDNCFSAPPSAVEEIQQRRTTLCNEDRDRTELTEIQKLLKQAHTNHLRVVHAQRRLDELHRLKSLFQKELEAVEKVALEESRLRDVQGVMSEIPDLQRLVQEGRDLKETFFVQRHRETLPPEQRAVQVEMHRQKWAKIVGQVDLHNATAAWPF